MKKLLPIILLLPCISMGANATPKTNRVGNTIAATIRHTNAKTSVTGDQETFPLKGFVRDATGQPLIGVTVGIKGTTTGVQTDVNGKFSISANAGDVLTFTYLGYVKKEVTIATGADLTIELAEDSKQLSEV